MLSVSLIYIQVHVAHLACDHLLAVTGAKEVWVTSLSLPSPRQPDRWRKTDGGIQVVINRSYSAGFETGSAGYYFILLKSQQDIIDSLFSFLRQSHFVIISSQQDVCCLFLSADLWPDQSVPAAPHKHSALIFTLSPRTPRPQPEP